MVNRRRGRLASLFAVLAALLSVLTVASVTAPASGAEDDGTLAIRSIDGTQGKEVQLTFLWTGPEEDLSRMSLRQEGVAQDVSLTALAKTDEQLSTVLVVDVSGAMNRDGMLAATKRALHTLVANKRSGDRMALVSYSDEVVVDVEFTTNVDQLDAGIEGLTAPNDGKRATYDALKRAALLFKDERGRQANIVLASDGKDDASKNSVAETAGAISGSGAALFVANLDHAGGVDTGTINGLIGRYGGTMVSGSDAAGAAQAIAGAAGGIGRQYVATFTPPSHQGAANVVLTVGSQRREGSYVAGARSVGSATVASKPHKKSFGPEWLHGSAGLVLVLATIGLAVGLLVFAVAGLATSSGDGLNALLRPYEEGGPVTDDGDQGLAQTAFLQRAVEMTEDFAERQGFLQKVEKLLERADLPLRAAEALFFYGAGVVIVGLGALFLFGLVSGLMLAGILALLPPAGVSFLAGKRQKAFVASLPDTLHLLSGSLRAGYSLMQGVEAVSQEVEDPMGKELRRVVTEARLGREVEDALEAVADRMESPDFAWAVMAIRIQREVGGNLSELLLTVADTMVHRDRLRRDVAALTAEGKISAIILGLLPIGLGLFMWMGNPAYMSPLGTTGMGQAMLGLAALAAGIGFFWMKKTIEIEI